MKVFGKEILSIVEMRSKHCSFYSLKFQPMDFSFFFFFQLFGYQICVSDTNPFFLKDFFFWTVTISSALVALLPLLALL